MSSFLGVSFGRFMSRAVSISMVIDYKSMGGGMWQKAWEDCGWRYWQRGKGWWPDLFRVDQGFLFLLGSMERLINKQSGSRNLRSKKIKLEGA